MPSIHDVAKRAGVSPSTVSRTFGDSSLISPETRRRVHQAAEELDYRPRRTPSRTGRGSAATSGLSLRQITVGFQFFACGPDDSLDCNLFYAPVLSGAQAEAAQAGVHLFVNTTDRFAMKSGKPLQVEQQPFDGLLLVGTADQEALDTLASHVPLIVLVDLPDPTGKQECILSDGFSGAYQATRHLIELGHRHIAFYAPELDVPSFQERKYGYLCALNEAGIPWNERDLYTRPTTTYRENEIWLQEKLSRPDRPTAIVAANDFYALFAMRICNQLQIPVPESLSIVGFDDNRESQFWSPPLTTIRVDKETMGRLAMHRLLQQIKAVQRGGTPLSSCRCVMPVSLIVRSSTAPPARF